MPLMEIGIFVLSSKMMILQTPYILEVFLFMRPIPNFYWV